MNLYLSSQYLCSFTNKLILSAPPAADVCHYILIPPVFLGLAYICYSEERSKGSIIWHLYFMHHLESEMHQLDVYLQTSMLVSFIHTLTNMTVYHNVPGPNLGL
jgi:hypothetical protein